MASSIYRYGTATTQSVTITEDDNRNIGDVDVMSVQNAIDITNDNQRDLGQVLVSNRPAVEVEVDADTDSTNASGASLAASGSNTYSLTAPGSDVLDGRVKSSGSYDLSVEWQDANGNTIYSETIATGVAAGTWTSFTNKTMWTPYAVVTVTDVSGNSQTVDVATHAR